MRVPVLALRVALPAVVAALLPACGEAHRHHRPPTPLQNVLSGKRFCRGLAPSRQDPTPVVATPGQGRCLWSGDFEHDTVDEGPPQRLVAWNEWDIPQAITANLAGHSKVLRPGSVTPTGLRVPRPPDHWSKVFWAFVPGGRTDDIGQLNSIEHAKMYEEFGVDGRRPGFADSNGSFRFPTIPSHRVLVATSWYWFPGRHHYRHSNYVTLLQLKIVGPSRQRVFAEFQLSDAGQWKRRFHRAARAARGRDPVVIPLNEVVHYDRHHAHWLGVPGPHRWVRLSIVYDPDARTVRWYLGRHLLRRQRHVRNGLHADDQALIVGAGFYGGLSPTRRLGGAEGFNGPTQLWALPRPRRRASR